MNLSTDRKNVRRLAKLYRMSETDIREMIAIASGRMISDVRQVDLPQTGALAPTVSRNRIVYLVMVVFAIFRGFRRKLASVDRNKTIG